MSSPFQPDPHRILDALDALDALGTGEWSLDDARSLLGDVELCEGLLGVTHIMVAYMVKLGGDPTQITAAARNLVRHKLDTEATR